MFENNETTKMISLERNSITNSKVNYQLTSKKLHKQKQQ